MELPQPRPLGRQERRKKQTHDFLSLYEPVQQDPNSPPPSSQAGNFLRTHEFLQPLSSKGENNGKEVGTSSEKPPTRTGGIGTSSLSHISLFNNVLKVEGGVFTMAQAGNYINKNDVNSNCSSYPINGFTLWERSAMRKGKTRKENIAAGDIPVGTEAAGIIIGEGEWPSQSSSNNSSSNHHHLTSTTYTSQPFSAKKNQSFMDMLKSAKISHHNEDDDEDEREFIIKDEPFSNPTMIVDAKRDDKKPSTPRSKHSATEQRRRSKINDRFQSLREIIPQNDQKRDKASFLLEVIEYIQYLQEKVQKYEGPYPYPYQRWNQNQGHAWASNHDNNCSNEEPQLVMSSTPIINNNINDVNFWTMNASIADCHTDGNKLKAQEHDVDNDTIKISTAYSRGLLSNLTRALQSSGVDLSEATISVKIDIGKQPNAMELPRSDQSSKRLKTGT